MSEQSFPKLSRAPFYLADALMVATACLIYWQGNHFPWQGRELLSPWEAGTLAACMAIGALAAILPHLLDHRAAARIAEAAHLDHAVLQVRNIEAVAQQISSATAGWQGIQDEATKAVLSAKEISETMSGEAQAFQDFLQKANDTEKHHLRLEVEKMRRAEGDWLQVQIHFLDHTYGIHQAALRSGHPGVAEQLGQFQKICRDVARRVGLTALVPKTGDPFDAKQHQLADPQVVPAPDAVIADVVATGYRYQGQVVRLPVVTLRGARDEASDLSMSAIAQRREQGAPSRPTPAPAAAVEEQVAPAQVESPQPAPAADPTTTTEQESLLL